MGKQVEREARRGNGHSEEERLRIELGPTDEMERERPRADAEGDPGPSRVREDQAEDHCAHGGEERSSTQRGLAQKRARERERDHADHVTGEAIRLPEGSDIGKPVASDGTPQQIALFETLARRIEETA
jgi:hypothetical protein